MYYKALFFKLYFGSLFSVFWFATLVAVLRFLQVCVWKRVKEFNEELLSRIISLSLMAICGLQGALTNPEFKLFAIISGIIEKMEQPLSICDFKNMSIQCSFFRRCQG